MKTSLFAALAALIATPMATMAGKDGKRGKKGRKGNGGMPKKEARVFSSLINAAQEVVADPSELPMSDALGNAYVTFDPNTYNMCILMAYQGLSGPELFSHIHAAPIGMNGPVVFTLSEEPVKNDCFKLDAEQRYQLWNGEFYFNVHSDAYPGGEIRGQILYV